MRSKTAQAVAVSLGLALAGLWAPPAQAIVGTSVDDPALARHVVMVLNRSGATAGFCSGVVLAPTVVLTAAHCVAPGSESRVHFRDEAGAPVLLDVAAVERNPGYRPDAIRTRQRSIDLALVRTATPLPARFEPASIDEGGPPAVLGTAFRLGGYGLRQEGVATTSGEFRTGTIVVRAPLSSLLLWGRGEDRMGTGACTGDSGGPVFDAAGDRVAALILWSAGAGKAQCGALTQAIWLAPQRGWIDAVLARWGLR